MKTSLALFFALVLAALVGCTKPRTLSGEWELHLGRSIEVLSIIDSNGQLSGTVRIDKDWGGATVALTGLRVGERVEIRYDNPNLKPGAPTIYCLTGNFADATHMSGTCEVIGGANDLLWTAERILR